MSGSGIDGIKVWRVIKVRSETIQEIFTLLTRNFLLFTIDLYAYPRHMPPLYQTNILLFHLYF